MFRQYSLPKIKGRYQHNINIGQLCWLKTNAIVNTVFTPSNIEDLQYFVRNKPTHLKISVIGAGSNLFIKANQYNAVIIRLGSGFNFLTLQNNCITAGSSCLDCNVSSFALYNNLSNLEFYVGIPGTIGGAIRMNAGAYHIETKDILIDALAINLQSGKIKNFLNKEIGFRYRDNNIGPEWMFVQARFRGVKKEQCSILDTMRKIKNKRQNTQPIYSKTIGSVFKNPCGYKVWGVLNQCGLKGFIYGGAMFSVLHCNFIINYNHAKRLDVAYLINIAQFRSKEIFNIDLKEEIKTLE